MMFGLSTLVLGSLYAASLAPAAGFGDLMLVHGRDHLEAGEAAEALTQFEGYLRRPAKSLDSVFYETRFLAAKAALFSGQASVAIEHLADLESALPEVRDVIVFYRGKAQRQAGLWQLAQSTWLSVTRDSRSPWRSSALYDLADTYYALGDLAGAAAAYNTAVERNGRDPRVVVALYNLGRLAEMRGNFIGARDHYENLGARFPSHPLHEPAHERLIFLEGLAGIMPAREGASLRKVDKLLMARSLDQAEAALNELAAQGEKVGHTEATKRAIGYRLGQLYYRQHHYDVAADTFNGLLRQEYNSRRRRDYERWLARTYSAAGRTGEAVEVHLKIYHRHESTAAKRDALYRAAWLAYNGGAFGRAVKLFDEFLTAFPNDGSTADALWHYGWSAFRAGDLRKAQHTLRRLRRRYPTSSTAHRALYWLARIEWRIGRQDKARTLYRETMQARPMTYYAVLAEQRLREMGHSGILVASVGNGLAGMLSSETDEPEAGLSFLQAGSEAQMPAMRDHVMPWGETVFDWEQPAARRTLRLIRLGLMDIAADEVADLRPIRGVTRDAAEYARARLLYGLGDYHRAHRISGRIFRRRLKDPVSPGTRRFSHLAYPAAHRALTKKVATEVGISPLLIWSLMRQESAYDDRARSWASANGLMQIIPRTGRKIAARLGVDDKYNFAVLQDPNVNVKFGAWYLGQLLHKFHGHVALAVGSYNAGPVAMARWLDRRPRTPTDEFVEDIPYRETRQYIKRVLGNLAVYQALYGKQRLQLPLTVPAAYRNNINF